MAEENNSYAAKRPVWQWVLIYAVIGIVVYGLIYYFVLSKKGGSVYSPTSSTPPVITSEASPSSSAAAAAQEVIILTANGFSPSTLTIKLGTEVTWVNQSGVIATVDSNPHPVHTDYSPLNLGNFPDGGKVSLTFDKAGTYGYHNHLNSSQKGAITVEAN